MESKRIFVAIKITNTNQIREIFRQVELDLSKEKIKWVKKDLLHITLLFIGNKRINEIPDLIEKLRKISRCFSSLQLNLMGMGTFPSFNNPRILWIGVKSNPVLFNLQKEIQQQERNGVETYKYTPHLTIGRIKGGVKDPTIVKMALSIWNEWEGDELEIKEFVLMESILSDNGPKYMVLETFPLNE